MAENGDHPVRIDLIEFKIHIHLKDKLALSLHFNTPSRKFYLSLIALVVTEMKKRGKIVPISLVEHLGLLALLNETVGGSAGSSEKENLLPRIYRKWKHALPDLEEAPLFKVLGKKKEFDGVDGKTYLFTEPEKDRWANLFVYIGSEENVRLKFAIDKIGGNLDDIVITYGDLRNQDAWESFLAGLQGEAEEPEAAPGPPVSEEPRVQAPRVEEGPTPRPNHVRRLAWVLAVFIVLAVVTVAVWKTVSKPAPLQVASIERMAYPLPDQPSIAVLPFENLSGDPTQEFFSDGITEAIITALSKVPRLLVIARKSTFTYKGKPVMVKQVSEDLGVRYVLEGSVQKSGDRVRITAQLIDALSGNHLWAERYDRNLKDIFAVQDEITMNILIYMRVKLTEGEQALRIKPPRNLEAFLKALQAQESIQRLNKEGNTRGKVLAEEAIALDPDFSGAYTLLCLTNFLDVSFGYSKSPKESIEKAIELAQKAIVLDPKDSRPYAYLGYLFTMKRDYGQGIAEGERAVSLDPGGADAHAWLGVILNYADKPGEAIPLFRKGDPPQSKRTHPTFTTLGTPTIFREVSGSRHPIPESVARLTRQCPGSPCLTATFTSTGTRGGSPAEAKEVLRINPKFSLETYAKSVPHKNQVKMDHYIEALRRAGLK